MRTRQELGVGRAARGYDTIESREPANSEGCGCWSLVVAGCRLLWR